MTVTKRGFVRGLCCGTAAVLSGGCVGQRSSGGDETADSTAEQTTRRTPRDEAGLAVHNFTDTELTVSVTVTAVASAETVFERSVSLGTEDREDYRGFSGVFTAEGTYRIGAETDRGSAETETTTYDYGQWNYWSVGIEQSGIRMNAVYP